MSLALLLPAGLAALAALLLPLLIHLARRSEQRPTEFAALRWLRQKPKPRHRIRFDEWPLLLLRLLLLILLALLLARPVWLGGERGGAYVAVVPGVDAAQARAAFGNDDARWHWLAPDFPELQTAPPSSNAPVTSLLRELDARLPADTTLTVFVPEQIDRADGARIALSHRIDWRVMAGTAAHAASAPAAPAPRLTVRYAPAREPALRYLRAANTAWQTGNAAASQLDAALQTQALPGDARSLVWLVPGPVPTPVREWIRKGGTALLDVDAALDDAPTMVPLWRDDTGATLVEGGAYGQGRVLQWRRDLVPRTMPELLEPDFPQHLRALFAPPTPPPARALAKEHAPVDGGPTFPIAPRDLQPWLILLVALVFVFERTLASGARRSVAP